MINNEKDKDQEQPLIFAKIGGSTTEVALKDDPNSARSSSSNKLKKEKDQPLKKTKQAPRQ
jgi:hypothetical protein